MSQQPFGQPQQQYSQPQQGGKDFDPFESNSAPSLSFKDAPIGTVYRLEVTQPAVMLQSRNFETSEPEFWPAGRDGQQNPKMAAVVNGTVEGEERSVWATKPSSMFAAIAKAQKDAGKKLAPGDILEIAYVGDKPNENPRLNAAKQYQARLTPAGPGSTGDAFAQPAAEQPVQQAFPPAQAQQPAPVQQQAPAPTAAPQQAFPPATQPPAQAAAPSSSPWDVAPQPPQGGAPF